MRPGKKLYLKHLMVLFVLVLLSIGLCCEEKIPNAIHSVLFIFTFLYLIVFFFGYVFNLGPFSYISKAIVKDHKDELEELGSKKQPWE